MRIKNGYLIRQIAEKWVVLPVGEENLNFNGMLMLNDSGCLLWQALEQGADRQELAKVLTDRYEVSEMQALVDVDEFVENLTKAGCIE